MKASNSFHVTLANASGVSKYHTVPLIASILLYLKQIAGLLKVLAVEFSMPPDNNNPNRLQPLEQINN